ncbi:MAG TPA: A24 family peptidase C-terminal domain-containing protein [Methanoregulaceae archaeon]|nr:A24 family peptidase C-terminal domain-containing protein [Methanoregulaceae archaeon]HPD74602.1 A24 family peptidase C-terminal domain-containing protein [Methanoregulaceae archaeon]
MANVISTAMIADPIQIPMAISATAVTATLLYASVLDVRDRRVPFRTWYPMLAVGIPAAAFFYITLILSGRVLLVSGYLALCVIFSLIFYLFAAKNLFGGADAWALIFISACVPFFPIPPYFGYPPLGFLPFTVLTNAVILNLFTPLAILVMNLLKGNWAPFPYMFFGFPVEGAKIQKEFGFVMEDFSENGGTLARSFVGIRESLRRMLTGEGRVYTKDLRLHPERFRKELALYKKAGTVWISYAVPFMIPITAGLITAIFFGDFLYVIMKIIAGTSL